ncbi:hypothetical protein V7S43_015943 [Phytophthora oleae]|uniref:PH domain-containing protein n=1 Tax=Phytophthora oleae TaxID=2107226 RepID=A0ABD3F1Q8_9STRA
MPGNQSRKPSTGLQLLSPTLQQSIQNSTSKLSSSHSAEIFGWSSTPPAGSASPDLASDSNDKEINDPTDFDFDGFTLESVRGRKTSIEIDASGTSRSSRAQEKHTNGTGDYCAFYYDDSCKPNPLSCSMGSMRTTTTTEDLEMTRRLRQSSFQKHNQRASVASRGASEKRSTFQLSSTATAAGFPMAKKKELTAVVMRGWLQKRKGLVLKRWKPYYCLFKSDDSLCLYASEDTINGKLEQRYQILRVVLTDKNDSFHIIGVDAEGAPRREEFRASVSPEWNSWFQVLGKFFDTSSMEQAFVRKPELTFTKTCNEAEEDDWVHDNSDIDPMFTIKNAQPFDARHSYFSQRKQSIAAVRISFDGSGDDKTSTVSSSSVPSVGVNTETTSKAGNQKLSDCPMIERKSQGTVPILEIRRSESMQTAALSSGFSWTE